jgi:DNA-binding NtrC family response regulator
MNDLGSWGDQAPPGRWWTRLVRSIRARWVPSVAVVAVLLYSMAVLATVVTTGDLGLRCVFSQRIIDVLPNAWSPERAALDGRFRVIPRPADRWSARPPAVGDLLLDVGPKRVANYHDFVQALRYLRGSLGERVEVRWEDGAGNFRVGQVRMSRPPLRAYIWSLLWFAQEMTVFGLGVVVFWRRPHDESARLFFWLCVATVGAFMGGYHWTQIVVHPPLIYLFAAFAVFVPILSLRFYLVFPRTNPVFARHRRPLLGVLYAVPALSLAGLWGTMLWSALDDRRVQTALGALQTLAVGYVRLSMAIFLLCLVCLVDSYLRARSRSQRSQVQWILLATLLSLLPISYLVWDTWNAPARLGLSSAAWPMFVVSLFYTVAYATSITRYKLMQAEFYLNRGLRYVLASIALGLLYSGVLVLCTLTIGGRLLDEGTSVGVVAAGLTALVALVLTEAARHRVQRVIDRRFHREKYKFDQAMLRMSEAVGSLVDRPTLGRKMLAAACEVLRVDWGAIYLRDAAGGAGVLELAACHGPRPDELTIAADDPLLARVARAPTFRVVPALVGPDRDPAADALIALGGEVASALLGGGRDVAGLLVLGPKRSGMPFEDEEVAFLGALGSVAALAMRSAEIQATLEGLNHDLRDKVEKIAEQRRRILVLQGQLAGRAAEEPEREAEPARAEAAGPGAGAKDAPGDDAAFAAIRGSSRAVRRMVDLARKVAASPAAVLIRGESGTGKELLAEAVHRASPRAGGPFVKVHCAALSQNLLESELFGHVKGAFTGADRDRVGRFQQADGGTLFLDEIGDINWEVQTKLLRVLQEMAFEKVGSSQTISVNVRILAATHQDLEELIRTGRFREDLYYRLNVISLRTPALRERREDVFELAVHFLAGHARRAGKPVTHLDDAAVEALLAYDWPGNIRELENVVERAVVLADGPAVTPNDLPAEVLRPGRRRRAPAPPRLALAASGLAAREGPAGPPGRDDPARGDARGEIPVARPDPPAGPEADDFLSFERQRLLDALAEAGGNKAVAARLLAMPRSTFFSKLRKHSIA